MANRNAALCPAACPSSFETSAWQPGGHDVENSDDLITAGMVVIGDEILSGRTRDSNAHHLARVLTATGIDLKEVRFVADDMEAIGEAVNALRRRHTYVFTSGGIGPTHDDITADAIGDAFGLPVDHDRRALELLGKYYAGRDLEFTEARRRMARVPEGAALIDNPVSVAPGFIVGNVYVMAGVPAVFHAMVDQILPMLRTGRRLLSESVPCPFGEGVIGTALGEIQKTHPQTMIGSYPKLVDGRFSTEIVIRSAEAEALFAAREAVEAMVETFTRLEAARAS